MFNKTNNIIQTYLTLRNFLINILFKWNFVTSNIYDESPTRWIEPVCTQEGYSSAAFWRRCSKRGSMILNFFLSFSNNAVKTPPRLWTCWLTEVFNSLKQFEFVLLKVGYRVCNLLHKSIILFWNFIQATAAKALTRTWSMRLFNNCRFYT